MVDNKGTYLQLAIIIPKSIASRIIFMHKELVEIKKYYSIADFLTEYNQIGTLLRINQVK